MARVESIEVLLVEDSEDDAELTIRVLTAGVLVKRVQYAKDGARALDYLFGTGSFEGRDTSRMPGIILLDLNLPEVHGLDVLARVRADPRTADIPVVIMTGSTEDADVRRASTLGANAYIRKPIEFAAFSGVLEQVRARRGSTESAPSPG